MQQQLTAWRDEIQALSGGVVVVVRVETDRAENVLRIAPEFPGRPIIRDLLLKESFVAQFVRAHAVSVNFTGAQGTNHFILLNTARAADWEGYEDSLVAHEMGHVWLNALGYRSPAYDDPCLATNAGDIVQHILIREEILRRGFDYEGFWIRNHQRWLEQQELSPAASPDACQRLQLLSAWMDATLGLTEARWNKLELYLKHLRAHYPSLQNAAGELHEMLAGWNLWDRSLYEFALAQVTRILQRVLWYPL